MGSKVFKKKRGKFDEIREQRKKRRGDIARENAKRRKLENGTAQYVDAPQETGGNLIENENGDVFAFEDTTGEQPAHDEAVFYGLLTPDEQTYYSNINAKIVSNDFESADDRHAFIEAVYRESQGKELKLASSQSCSRYLEKIIMLSTSEQLRAFFTKVLGSLTHLVQHRFGSHVCETLFLEGAKHVTKGKETHQTREDDPASMEALILQAAAELQNNVGYMLTDRFASHTIRALLLVLSGEPLEEASTKALLASKKKEKLDAPVNSGAAPSSSRNVPKSFKEAMSSLISAAVTSLDATYLRALATHQTGNPVLQLLLKLELTNSDKGRQLKEDSLYHKLVSPDSIEGGEGAKFILGLSYDSAGSHLIEVLVVHSPGKIFKKLYKTVWKDKMSNLAKHEVASYVAIRILERLGKDDLAEARDMILPDLSTLLNRRKTAIIKYLVDRSVVRGLDLSPIAKALKQACGNEARFILCRLLGLEQTEGSTADTNKDSPAGKIDAHGSILAQSMLQAPDVCTLIQESLVSMELDLLLRISQDNSGSRVIQLALTSPTASTSFRKQMIPRFYEHVVELAKSPVGSFLVDTLWQATDGLHFMKESIARKLAAQETELRDSLSGRNVWRNWSMDTYQRRPTEWRALAKGQVNSAESGEKRKTAFQLAQERHTEQRPNRGHLSKDTSQNISTNA